MRKFRGGQKLVNRSQPFMDQSLPNLGDMSGSSCRWINFFQIVDIVFYCRDIFRSNSKSVFAPSCGVKYPGSSDQILQTAVISEYVQVWLRSVQ